MAFTDAQRAKAKATRMANAAKKTAVVIADPNEREKKLLAEIDEWKKKAGVAEAKVTEAEAATLMAVESQSMNSIEEKLTGKTITVTRCKGYKRVGFEQGRVVREPVFEEVEEPTYFYKIIMPPCGGLDLKINDVPYYHGQTVEVTLDVLRSIKDTVYKLWAHDASTHGSDENAYRKPAYARISARG